MDGFISALLCAAPNLEGGYGMSGYGRFANHSEQSLSWLSHLQTRRGV